MQAKTPMVLVLRDGEEIHGVIEWYDKACIKVNRASGPNLMIYKTSTKYMYKAGENVEKYLRSAAPELHRTHFSAARAEAAGNPHNPDVLPRIHPTLSPTVFP